MCFLFTQLCLCKYHILIHMSTDTHIQRIFFFNKIMLYIMFCSFSHTLRIQSIFVFINKSVTKFFRSLILFNNYLIDAFELWCWRRLSRAPWTARRSSQSILKEISPEYSFEGLMLKLKLQYFGHMLRRTDSFEKTLMLGKLEGGRRMG